MEKSKFVPLFKTWWPYIEPFFDEGGFEPIYKHLKDIASQHVRIFPLSGDTFRAFQETSYEETKTIWVGMCPYHTIWKGQPVADGLAFSCNGEFESPSLKVLYNAIEQDVGEVFLERPLKLDYLARQGVLLLNSSFTTEQGYADSHKELWRPFTEFLGKEVFKNLQVPIITFGASAREMLEEYIIWGHDWTHLLHPAYYARKKKAMEHNGVFSMLKEKCDIEFNYSQLKPF